LVTTMSCVACTGGHDKLLAFAEDVKQRMIGL
jgi:hypothetical protein